MLHRLFLLILGFVSWVGCAAQPPPAGPLGHVPLRTLDGRPTDLAGAAQGRVVVVALWASWCEACKTELPALARLAERARARDDFRVLGVAVGAERTEAAAYLAAHSLRFASLVDEEYALAAGLGTSRVPATFVLDRQGRVLYRGGALDQAALEALRQAMAR